jgi:RimJ/RimL family protein N-acetyltransferase
MERTFLESLRRVAGRLTRLSETFFIEPPIFRGEHVRIEPLSDEHAEGLFDLGQDPAIFKWLPRGEFHSLSDAEEFIRNALILKSSGVEYPFAVSDVESGQVAGTTRFLDISDANRSIEIGWTWYGAAFQRTPVNTETKFLLMRYAFEELGAIRVQFKTDSRNLRSQTAIQRLGAKLEGTLRNHRILPKDGYVRDSVYFSVLDSEWPLTKIRLTRLLNR